MGGGRVGHGWNWSAGRCRGGGTRAAVEDEDEDSHRGTGQRVVDEERKRQRSALSETDRCRLCRHHARFDRGLRRAWRVHPEGTQGAGRPAWWAGPEDRAGQFAGAVLSQRASGSNRGPEGNRQAETDGRVAGRFRDSRLRDPGVPGASAFGQEQQSLDSSSWSRRVPVPSLRSRPGPVTGPESPSTR